ncbi:MAG: hypothetical protein AAF568_01535 [Pseudomonadota bacterium]
MTLFKHLALICALMAVASPATAFAPTSSAPNLQAETAERPPILLAKKGGKILGGGKPSPKIGGKTVGGGPGGSWDNAGRNIAMLKATFFSAGTLGLITAGVIGLLVFVGLRRFLVFLYRGFFVRQRRGVVTGARMTNGGYVPIVAYEHRRGQTRQVLADFVVGRDPTGAEIPVEVSGSRARPVLRPRGFMGGILSVSLPFIVALGCFLVFAAYGG